MSNPDILKFAEGFPLHPSKLILGWMDILELIFEIWVWHMLYPTSSYLLMYHPTFLGWCLVLCLLMTLALQNKEAT